MRNFFYRLSGALARFMSGRNGSDQLNLALLAAYAVVLLARAPLGRFPAARLALEFFAVLLAALAAFRALSRNLPKRRAENARLLAWIRPAADRLSLLRRRRLDREHKYFVCKSCGAVCRVPAGKGKIEITCPRCGGKTAGKS